MRNFIFILLISIPLFVGCSSGPLMILPQQFLKIEKNQNLVAYPVKSESCGYYFLGLIPVSINNRQESAWSQLLAQAQGGSLADIKMEESWFYGYFVTGFCTKFSALVTRAVGP